MILYTNGDSHTAAAEATNPFAFAEDDQRYAIYKRQPHPANLAVSWSTVLGRSVKMMLTCQAESASSNARIIRTTEEWLAEKESLINPVDVLIIIQWSTWEREEWEIDGKIYQVNTSGKDQVPTDYIDEYKEYIANIDWEKKTQEAYIDIVDFHLTLKKRGYKHIFFNGNNTFFDISKEQRFDFGENYIKPYLPEESYDGWLQANGYNTVITSNYHYGLEAHAAWARRLLQHITDNEII